MRSHPSHRQPVLTEGRLAAVLLSPTALALGLVVGYPVVSALRLSFQITTEGIDSTTGMVKRSVAPGLGNYLNACCGSTADEFWNAFWNTTTFTVVTVTMEVILGTAMALLMNCAFRGRSVIRASILVPWAIPTAISGLLWRWIFQADGVANQLLGQFVGTKVLWTTEGFQSWLAVVIADTWKTAPFVGLLLLAGLQVIPADLYEAATVDGAGAWCTFRRITLPLVKPVLVVAVLFRSLDVLRMFDLPLVLVGQHKRSVETLTMLAWYEMSNLRFGPAAAYALVLFSYIALVAFGFVKLLGADLLEPNAGGAR